MVYALVMKICSAVALACSNPIEIKSFNNHYDCAINGYDVSKEILQDIGRSGVEKDKIVINFGCYENYTNKTTTSSQQ
jgi:hypothetical protein|tara:strand:- start:1571 stop:1804 length:234 start_codon:yes stop_codon:yes gene_type:complete